MKSAPQALAAEQAILEACFIENEAVHRIAERLKPADFYLPSHQKVFGAMLELTNRGEPIDLITIQHSLNGGLESIGGASHLAGLFENAFTSAHASRRHCDRSRTQTSVAENVA